MMMKVLNTELFAQILSVSYSLFLCLTLLSISQFLSICPIFIFRRHVLREQESGGISSLGGISIKNLFCLILCWTIVFFCLYKGIKTSGKVSQLIPGESAKHITSYLTRTAYVRQTVSIVISRKPQWCVISGEPNVANYRVTPPS